MARTDEGERMDVRTLSDRDLELLTAPSAARHLPVRLQARMAALSDEAFTEVFRRREAGPAPASTVG